MNASNQLAFCFDEDTSARNFRNHYLCCGEEWVIDHAQATSTLCPNCLSLVEPFVSDDGSIKKQQIENALIGARMRFAFGTKDEKVSESVFNGLLVQLHQTHFEPEAVELINY